MSVVAHVSDLPGGPHPADVRAMTAPDGRVTWCREPDRRMSAGSAARWAPVGLPQMLGPDGMVPVLRDVDALLASRDAIALRPGRLFLPDTPSHLVREDACLPRPEPSEARRRSAPGRGCARVAVRSSLRCGIRCVCVRPISSLATAAIRRTGGDMSKLGGVPGIPVAAPRSIRSRTQPYEDAVEKAGKYAATVRAAAQRWGDDVAMRAAVGGLLAGCWSAGRLKT